MVIENVWELYLFNRYLNVRDVGVLLGVRDNRDERECLFLRGLSFRVGMTEFFSIFMIGVLR